MTECKNRIEILPIEQGATTDLGNINKHSQRGGTLLENSLRKRGAFRSIASAGKGVDIPVTYAGNYTLEKAVEAGFKEIVNVHVRGDQLVNVVRDDIAPGSVEAIALGLEDNESAKQSYNPDIDMLAALAAGDNAILAQLRKEDKVFDGMLEGMLEEEIKDVTPEIDRAEELRNKWGTEKDQLWKIGNHFLLIGDSTKQEDIEKLMGDEKAALAITSPPYWVGKEYEKEKSVDEINKFIVASAKTIAWATREDESRIVINTGTGFTTSFDKKKKRQTLLLIDKWSNAFWGLGWNLRYIRHWLKHGQLASISARTDMIDQHCEWLGVFENDIGEVVKFGDRIDQDEVIALETFYNARGRGRGRGQESLGNYMSARKWALRSYWDDIHGEATASEHCAAFPLLIPLRHIVIFTVRDEIVVDFFVGSGTTIVACENLKRKCRAIEIEPKYVAVCLQRMQDAFPGIEIVKIE